MPLGPVATTGRHSARGRTKTERGQHTVFKKGSDVGWERVLCRKDCIYLLDQRSHEFEAMRGFCLWFLGDECHAGGSLKKTRKTHLLLRARGAEPSCIAGREVFFFHRWVQTPKMVGSRAPVAVNKRSQRSTSGAVVLVRLEHHTHEVVGQLNIP